MSRKPYTPRDWYWVVGGDESRAWSSAQKDFVANWPSDQTTRIANELELYDVLVKAGLRSKAPSRTFSLAEVRSALLLIDAAATGDASDEASLRAVAEDIGFSLPPVIA